MTYNEIKILLEFDPPKEYSMGCNGFHTYMAFVSDDRYYINRYLGKSNPHMEAEKALTYLTPDRWDRFARAEFADGWNAARDAYLKRMKRRGVAKLLQWMK